MRGMIRRGKELSEVKNMNVSGYVNYMQNNVNTLIRQTPAMQTVELKPEYAMSTDRLELSPEGTAQKDTLNVTDPVSIKIPREWTIGGETIISSNTHLAKTLEKANSLNLSYGERLEFIHEEQEKWVNDKWQNDPMMFVQWLKLKQDHIENGRPDLAGETVKKSL